MTCWSVCGLLLVGEALPAELALLLLGGGGRRVVRDLPLGLGGGIADGPAAAEQLAVDVLDDRLRERGRRARVAAWRTQRIDVRTDRCDHPVADAVQGLHEVARAARLDDRRHLDARVEPLRGRDHVTDVLGGDDLGLPRVAEEVGGKRRRLCRERDVRTGLGAAERVVQPAPEPIPQVLRPRCLKRWRRQLVTVGIDEDVGCALVVGVADRGEQARGVVGLDHRPPGRRVRKPRPGGEVDICLRIAVVADLDDPARRRRRARGRVSDERPQAPRVGRAPARGRVGNPRMAVDERPFRHPPLADDPAVVSVEQQHHRGVREHRPGFEVGPERPHPVSDPPPVDRREERRLTVRGDDARPPGLKPARPRLADHRARRQRPGPPIRDSAVAERPPKVAVRDGGRPGGREISRLVPFGSSLRARLRRW